MSTILNVKDLKKSFKKGFIPKRQEVLKGVSFKIDSGAITGFLGGNGAGKTTTMKCILELAFADSGTVEYFDGQPLSREVKKKIGYLPERPYFYEYLTGAEFLKFYGRLSGDISNSVLESRITDLLKRVDLTHARDKRLREYSKGMLQKVGMAQALIHEPEFVILDEPMAGLDPDGRRYLSDIIKETASRGTAVFFSSHLLHDAERLCKDLVILREGVVKYQGPTEDFLDKMGAASNITYFASGEKKVAKVNSLSELQSKIQSLQNDGAQVLDVRPDRSLEEAFTRVGLRGDEL